MGRAFRCSAGYAKQSVLQAVGIRYVDLDPIARKYLDLYARVVVKVRMYDECPRAWRGRDRPEIRSDRPVCRAA
jgi:hypothetical protein